MWIRVWIRVCGPSVRNYIGVVVNKDTRHVTSKVPAAVSTYRLTEKSFNSLLS